jgi:hypothetical protein
MIKTVVVKLQEHNICVVGDGSCERGSVRGVDGVAQVRVGLLGGCLVVGEKDLYYLPQKNVSLILKVL